MANLGNFGNFITRFCKISTLSTMRINSKRGFIYLFIIQVLRQKMGDFGECFFLRPRDKVHKVDKVIFGKEMR